MDLTIQQADLAYAVGRALDSVPPKSTLTILQALLLDAQDDTLRVTGTDLDVTTSITLPCAAKSPGRAAVHARHFADAVRKLPRESVRVADEEGSLTVFYGKGKSQVPKLDDQDFPMQPEVRPESRITIEGPVLARLIQRSAYAVSSDETRAVLNGVLVQASDKDIALVATDGHRLARARRKGAFGAIGKEGFVVPGRTLQMVGKMAGDATSPVEIGLSPGRNQAAFRLKVGSYDVVVFSRLLEGPFPNYEQVIPKGNDKLLSVARTELQQAIDRVATHSDNITHQVKLELAAGKVTVRVNTTDVGAGEETIEAKYAEEPMAVAYNANYLLDILKSLDSERVALRLDRPTNAGIVEPEGGLKEAEEDLLCLIMPLRLPEPSEMAGAGEGRRG
jgi:DNA polymerase-3 subunit beta